LILSIVAFNVGTPTTVIEEAIIDSPAYISGIEQGDNIISINGIETNTWNKISNTISKADPVEKLEIKNGQVFWPIRTALTGKEVTPGGAIEIADILGKEESIRRIKIGIEKLSHNS